MAPKKSASQSSADEQVVDTSTAPAEDLPNLDDLEDDAPEPMAPPAKPEAPAAEVPVTYRAKFMEAWRYYHGAAYSDLPKGHVITSNDYDFKKLVAMKAPLALLDEDGDPLQILSEDDFADSE